MAPTAHSAFSASGAKRGLACPGSLHWSQVYDTGVRTSSIFAAEGTLAHAISEACLHTGKEPEDFIGQTRHADGFDIAIDEDFAENVRPYVDFLRGLKAMGFIILLERRVSPQIHWAGLTPLPIDLFGTSDCIAYHPQLEILVIADLKFGKGVVVEVKDNPQVKYYAAGSIDQDLLKAMLGAHGYPVPTGQVQVREVRTTIIQPRAFHPDGPVRTETYRPEEIIEWSRTDLYEGVKKAINDKGKTICAGEWCRFCPALVNCEAPKKLTFDAALAMFMNTPIENIPAEDDAAGLAATPPAFPGMSDDDLGALMDKISIVEPWIAAVKAHAKERREKGRDVKGWALVPNRALRRWADQDKDAMFVTLNAVPTLDPDEYSERSLLTPAQVQKRIGKKRYDKEVAPHVVKTSSGMNLVPDGDPRARVRSRTAQEAFNLPAPTDNNHPLKD